MFNKKDDSHEFKPILSEIQDRPINPLGRATFWIVVTFIIFAILWMYFGKIDVVVTARGKIIPSGNIKMLEPLETGVVKKILVKEGDFVKKGQVLMEIDPSTTEPELESLEDNLLHYELEKNRLNAETYGQDFISEYNEEFTDTESLKTQQDLFKNSLESLNNQLTAKQMNYKMIEEQIKSTQIEKDNNNNLLNMEIDKETRLNNVIDLIAKKDLEEVQANITSYKSKVQSLNHKLIELKHEQSQIMQEINYIQSNYKSENLKMMSEIQKENAKIKAQIKEINFRNRNQKIISPVDGHINTLYVHTVGGVVTPAKELISIVPINTPLIIKANVLNKDIGFIEDKMPVSIKVDTFSFQKYGLLNGIVSQISKDSNDDEK
ncbi:MAG: HlyD family type I secretion periplasmic adaptor subunit, partial [Vampirovibrionia bacterium]